MWRKFLGVGIPILIVGVILIIVGATQTWDWDYGYNDSAHWLFIFGYILSAMGGLLVQAGLIGAAVGADPRTQARGVYVAPSPYAAPWRPRPTQPLPTQPLRRLRRRLS